MTLSLSLDYDRFLSGSAAALVSRGAQILLSPTQPAALRPAWSHWWNQVLLLNAPGTARLYAFTCADGARPEDLRGRLDQLAHGLSARGVLSGAPVQLVAVFVFVHGVDRRRGRRVTGLTPSQYYPGLRPAAWAVDLPAGSVQTGAWLTTPEDAELLRGVLQADGGQQVADPADLASLQHTYAQRTEAFYRLMRGRQPLVTYALILINVGLFLLLYGSGGPGSDQALRQYGALSPRLVEQGQWWRLFTSMFLHASVAHILFNMTSLYAVGTLAERLYGSARFLGIYLGAGLIGSVVSFLYAVVTGNLDILGVGASGAIFGVAGALITVRFQASDAIPESVRRRVSSSMLPLVVISLVMSFLTPHVDNAAHLGGLFGGMALSLLLPLTRSVPELSR
jgi:membrane associated rhomboid family serine protease